MTAWKKANWAFFAPIPALLIGAIVMWHNDIGPLLYGQNILCYLVLGLPLLLATKSPHADSKPMHIVVLMLGSALLACTFLNRGLENVHRWIAVGGIRLYIASIVLPCMIIGFGALLRQKSAMYLSCLCVFILLLLLMQPDASQLSAFAVSITFLILKRTEQKAVKFGISLLSIGFIVYSWLHLDTLEAVPHVEDILSLARDMGIVWFFLGIVSLLLLLTPLLFFPNVAACARAVGLYYLVVFISTLWGNFPVPIMGFGISPIIGYMLALFFLLRMNYCGLRSSTGLRNRAV